MRPGYTYVEMVLSIVILIIVTVSILPVFGTFLYTVELRDAKETILTDLRFARLHAISGNASSTFGAHFDGNAYTLFRGETYATRDTTKDTHREVAENVSITGMQEITFATFSGNPSVTGTIVLHHAVANTYATLTVHLLGLLE